MTFFILGSHPQLSIAEIQSALGSEIGIIRQSKDVLIIHETRNDLSVLQQRLAGVIKIGHIIGEQRAWNLDELVDLIVFHAADAPQTKKIFFGLSVYPLASSKRSTEIEQSILLMGKKIKHKLKESGQSVRFVSSRKPQLSSVIVSENHLLESVGEYVLLVDDQTIWIGHTETVQDYKSWSKRDYGRPSRDPKSGMLPPKLARMMINLSGVDPTQSTLFDPFCGSGTILMEASLLGFQRVIGSDISEKAIHATQKNLAWLKKKVDEKSAQPELFCANISDLHKKIKQPVDVIVTETFLGKPRTHLLRDSEIDSVTKPLIELYKKTLDSFSKLLKHDGKIVIAFPLFKLQNGSFYALPLKQFFEKSGFSIKQTFSYHRPDQFVGREIIVLSHFS